MVAVTVSLSLDSKEAVIARLSAGSAPPLTTNAAEGQLSWKVSVWSPARSNDLVMNDRPGKGVAERVSVGFGVEVLAGVIVNVPVSD